jgi:hypothetical protein
MSEVFIPNSVGVVGQIFSAALDHLGGSDTVRGLSHVLTEHYGTSSLLLFGLKNDTSLELVQSFGFSESTQKQFGSMSLFAELPISDSIRGGEITRFLAEGLLERYPTLSELDLPQEVFYVAPCTSSGSPVGGFIVGFFSVGGGEEVPLIVLQALQVAAYHVLSRQPDFLEMF